MIRGWLKTAGILVLVCLVCLVIGAAVVKVSRHVQQNTLDRVKQGPPLCSPSEPVKVVSPRGSPKLLLCSDNTVRWLPYGEY